MPHPAANVILDVGDFVAQFVTVPALIPVLGLVREILEVCDTIHSNRKETIQLQQRCRHLITALRDEDLQAGTKMSQVVEGCVGHLREVLIILSKFSKYTYFESLLHLEKISGGIKRCHEKIDDCCRDFQIRSHIQLHQWKSTFEVAMRDDHAELLATLIGMNEELLGVRRELQDSRKEVSEGFRDIRILMQLYQEQLRNSRRDSDQYLTLQGCMYQIQSNYGELPPDIDLKSGEARRIGKAAVRGTAAFDIFKGIWLGRENVALKAVREVRATPETWQQFKQEVKIWQEVGLIDRGRYILPFYGVFRDEGPNPYMVSPWMVNGDVMQYLQKHPMANRMDLIKGIAKGLSFLHNIQQRSIVHGNVKANVFIGDTGQPLLADFGLSKVLENVNGVPFTQSTGVTESYRWLAPELCKAPGILSTHSDVYSYSMTVVEIMTDKVPFSHITRNTQVLLDMQEGERPQQPTDEDIVERGLNDHLWSILCVCWRANPQDRPTIDEVLAQIG